MDWVIASKSLSAGEYFERRNDTAMLTTPIVIRTMAQKLICDSPAQLESWPSQDLGAPAALAESCVILGADFFKDGYFPGANDRNRRILAIGDSDERVATLQFLQWWKRDARGIRRISEKLGMSGTPEPWIVST
ncbi:hypothetical protein FYK55_00485 [Roseiconus nitratireducens]|uniref:Uncharacterized protein n=1 Tax=Roseiconus nitratireducens TaxID=2605748 RepID=A0A5M6DKM8_9BACT|nr:hypothetical protein [Roseiconus nitratireducens]KAA5546936.1 hypothetical protein FYK55_00485 [Roseiconus nitratireducens]